MAEPVQLWRYRVPSIDGEGYATVVLGSDGYFSAVSDWGNYAYRWTATGCDDFRDFVLRSVRSPAYWVEKLGRGRVYDADATEAEVKAYVENPENFTSEAAREEELEHLKDSDLGTRQGLDRWMAGTCIEEAYLQFGSTMPDPEATAFVTRAMPRICALIEAELAAERTAALESGRPLTPLPPEVPTCAP